MDPSATATRPMATPAVRVEKNLATVRPVYPAHMFSVISEDLSRRHRRHCAREPWLDCRASGVYEHAQTKHNPGVGMV